MKDLDFDELDRAVNTLMQSAPVAEPEPKPTDEQSVLLPSNKEASAALSNTTTTNVADQDSAGMPIPGITSISDITRRTPQPSVASRRGRFMDVVRPNAAKSFEQPTRSISRQGATIEPKGALMSDVIPISTTPPVAQKEPTIVQSIPAQSVHIAPTPSEVASPKKEWPDPIEMAGYEESTTPQSAQREEKPFESDIAPLVSPFLPGAKVEKRPLGGANPVVDLEQPTPEDQAKEILEEELKSQSTADSQLSSTVTEPSAQLPDELTSDVMALEAGANTIALPAEIPHDEATTASEPSVVSLESATTEQETIPAQPNDTAAPVSTPVIPAGPISIPQQYKEEPNTGDKDNGSIYDTSTYHQPLAHPGKKKSGWLWVVWIVLILIVGAAIGAGLYFMGTFRL